MRAPVIFAALAIAVPGASLEASPFVAPDAIDAAAAQFLGAEVGTPGGAARRVDARLKLASCPEPLAVAWYGRNNATLQIGCPARGWRVFVPVGAGHAGAGTSGEVVIERGETVSVSYEGSGFTLTRQGEALEPGRTGQWIRIRPSGDKAQPIKAQVLRPGAVRITAG